MSEAAKPAPGRGEIKAYTVGPPPSAGARRLHLNEFRFEHSPGVVAALRATLDEVPVEDLLTNYQAGPDPALAADLARYVGAPGGENILLTPGSDEALRAVIDTSGLRGHRKVVMGVPGYTHFEHYARLKGLEITTYAIGLETRLADHAAALAYHRPALEEGCLVYLCSPNNPTGDLWTQEVVAQLATRYPRSLFLVDEAYVEFASVAGGAPPGGAAEALNSASVVQAALAHDNVVVTRTLSKAFGLAALRIGYAVGRGGVIKELGVAVSPKAFGPVVSRVARAALRDAAHYRDAAVAAHREAARAVAALTARGWWALDTPGNFYLVYVGAAAETEAALAARGVVARNRDSLPGLAGFLRLTAGTAADTDAVIAAFDGLTAPPTAPQKLYTPKGIVTDVKELMRATAGILERAGVPFWAQGGTMLGMFRHGGMIPTDDDGDLAYARGDDGSDPVAGLVGAFAGAGLTLQRNRTDAYWQVGRNPPGTTISPVHVDVFSYSRTGSGMEARYLLDDERFRAEDPSSPGAHCNTSYSTFELFPLTTQYRFYDLPIPMPAESGAVLRRALGEDFQRVMRVRTPAGPVEVVLRDFTPA
jgi:histidinol-phosphate aminotransferase